jgi:hypothetical protein
MPEIAVKAGSTLSVPIVISHLAKTSDLVNVTVTAPDGWQAMNGAGRLRLPAENRTTLDLEIASPELNKEELKKAKPVDIVVGVIEDGMPPCEVRLRVLLKASALPE